MTGRRSRWFPSESKLWVSSLQTRLLYEDFHNQVVPYRHDPEPYELFTEGVSGHQVDESLSLGNAWQPAASRGAGGPQLDEGGRGDRDLNPECIPSSYASRLVPAKGLSVNFICPLVPRRKAFGSEILSVEQRT